MWLNEKGKCRGYIIVPLNVKKHLHYITKASMSDSTQSEVIIITEPKLTTNYLKQQNVSNKVWKIKLYTTELRLTLES